MLSVAFAGSDSSSTFAMSTSRPPSFPPLSCRARPQSVLDRDAQRREGARIRQHETDFDLAAPPAPSPRASDGREKLRRRSGRCSARRRVLEEPAPDDLVRFHLASFA